MSSPQAATRLHPGMVLSVILVSVAAVAAAVLIIRKYCFPVNQGTYRYSVLRRLEEMEEEEEERTAVMEEAGLGAAGEESDEDLLE